MKSHIYLLIDRIDDIPRHTHLSYQALYSLFKSNFYSHARDSITRYARRLVVQSQFAFSSVFRRVLHYIALYCTASAHTLKLAFSSLPLPTCTRLR